MDPKELQSALASAPQALPNDELSQALASAPNPQTLGQKLLAARDASDSAIVNGLGDVATGIGRLGYNLLTTGANNLKKLMPNAPTIQSVLPPPANLGGDTWADKGIQNISSFAAALPLGGAATEAGIAASGANLLPEVSTAAKMLGSNFGAGAINTPDNPIQGGLAAADTAGTMHIAAPLVTQGLKAGGQGLLGAIAQNSLAKKIGESVMNRVGDSSGLGASLKNAYDSAMDDFNTNQKMAEYGAKTLDNNVSGGANFDASPYSSVLNNFLDNYSKMSPVQQSSMRDAADFAQDQLDRKVIPQNFSDLMQQNRNLNNEAKQFFMKRYGTQDYSDTNTTSLIKNLKQGIQDAFDANSQGLPFNDVNSVKQSFNAANQAYSRAQQMGMLPDARGNLVPDSGLMASLKNGNQLDDATEKTLSNYYLNRGSLGFDALTSQIGEKQAQDAIATQILKNAGGKAGSVDNLQVRNLVDNYSKLPDEIASKVFSPDEKNILDALNSSDAKSKLVAGQVPALAKYAALFSPSVAGGLAGGYEGYQHGGIPGALVGAPLGIAGGSLVSSLLSNPSLLKAIYSPAAKEAPVLTNTAGLLGTHLASGGNQ